MIDWEVVLWTIVMFLAAATIAITLILITGILCGAVSNFEFSAVDWVANPANPARAPPRRP